MLRSLARLGLFVLAITALVACNPSTASPSGGAESPAQTAAASDDAGTSTAPSAEPSAAGDAGGGGSADACALLSADVVGSALKATGVKATPGPSDSDFSYCNYETADGKALMATSYTKTSPAVFDAYKSGSTPVPGLGDEAIWADGGMGGMLMIKKGSSILTLQPSGTLELSDNEQMNAMVEAAKAAIANL